MAGGAGGLHVLEEQQIARDGAHALARLAAAAGRVERERLGREPARARLRGGGEGRADGRPHVCVRGHVRAFHARDGRLPHGDDAVEVCAAGHGVLGAARIAAGQDVEHGRGLARAGRARHRHEAPGGDVRIQMVEVEPGGVAQLDRSALGSARRRLGRERAREEASRGGVGRGREVGERPLGHHAPAVRARAGAQVHQVVGRAHDVRVVLDDEHGVAQVAQAPQDAHEALRVAGVEPRGGLVQDVDDAGELRVQHGGQAQPLQLAARERGGCAVERQVVQAHGPDARELRLHVQQVVLHHRAARPPGAPTPRARAATGPPAGAAACPQQPRRGPAGPGARRRRRGRGCA